MIGVLGIALMLALAIALSENYRKIKFDYAIRALALQISVVVLALYTPLGQTILSGMSNGVLQVISYVQIGNEFIFGPLGIPDNGFIFAFQVLPVIIFMGAIFGVLFHIGIMDLVIRFLGGAIRYITGVSRLESTCAAANIFVGMAEAPLTILPYVKHLSRAQLFVVMSLGMSSVAGTVLVAYSALGIRSDLLLTAAFMAPAGGLLYSRILVPEIDTPMEVSRNALQYNNTDRRKSKSVIQSATNGALVGAQIMFNVLAVLIAFVAGIALLNGILGWFGTLIGLPDLSMQWLLGHIFSPVSYLLGVPWDESQQVGILLGEKIIFNELLAYANFAQNMAEFSPSSQVIVTVALCGFANLGSLGIMLAGLTAIIPKRQTEISKLGLKSILAGTLSNFTSAAIIGVIYSITQFFGN